MDKYRYCLCKKCGKEWNVSVLRKSDKEYICPICERRNQNETTRPRKGFKTVLRKDRD